MLTSEAMWFQACCRFGGHIAQDTLSFFWAAMYRSLWHPVGESNPSFQVENLTS